MKYVLVAGEQEIPACAYCKFYNWAKVNITSYHRCDVHQWQSEYERPYMPITGFCSLGEFKEGVTNTDENIEIAHVSYSDAEVGREK